MLINNRIRYVINLLLRCWLLVMEDCLYRSIKGIKGAIPYVNDATKTIRNQTCTIKQNGYFGGDLIAILWKNANHTSYFYQPGVVLSTQI